MINLGLILLSVIQILVIGTLFRWSCGSDSRIRTIVLGATLFHQIVLVVFPVWYSIFTGFYLESDIFVQAEDLFLVMTGEMFFVSMFGLGLYIGYKRRKSATVKYPVIKQIGKGELFALALLTTFGLIIYIRALLTPLRLLADVSGVKNLFYLVMSWFNALFFFTPLVASSILIARWSKFKYSRLLSLMGVTTLICLILVTLSTGIRGRASWVISLLVIVGFLYKKRRLIITGCLIAIPMIVLFSFLGEDFRTIYVARRMQGPVSRSEMISKIVENKNMIIGDSLSSAGADLLKAAASRAQGPRNSVFLYQQYDAGAGAGFATYVGSILFLIPRFIWPEKPMPGSTEVSELSSAIYLTQTLAYGEEGRMGPVLASAHAYWEGGWIWLFCAGLVTGLLWNLVLRWCDRVGESMGLIIALSFCAALLIDGLFTALNPLYSFIIIFWKWFIPTVLLFRFAEMVFPKRKKVYSFKVPSGYLLDKKF